MKLDKLTYYGTMFSWCFLAASVCLSKFTSTVATICVAFFSLLYLIQNSGEVMRGNGRILFYCLLPYTVLLLGLIHTDHFDFAFKSLHRKLPLLIFPVLLFLGPRFSKKEYQLILLFLVLGAISSALIGSSLRYFAVELTDPREYSPFISHIRLSLALVFSLLFILSYAIRSKWHYGALLLVPSFFIFWYFSLIESLTAVLLVPTVALIAVFLLLRKANYRRTATGVLIALLLGSAYLISGMRSAYVNVFQDPVVEQLEANTIAGKPYFHDTSSSYYENGHRVRAWICHEELQQEWPKRSKLGLDHDIKGYPLASTLYRYMSSLGLRKDSVGISKLSDLDIQRVEKGITNAYVAELSPVEQRFHTSMWEIKSWAEGGSAAGNSVTMRFTFWMHGWKTAQKNLWLGVGTGDVEKEAGVKYTKATGETQTYRSHNQYLSVLLAVGVVGLFFFLIGLIKPLLNYRGPFPLLVYGGSLLLLISAFWEDTFDSQAGSLLLVLLYFLPIINFSKADIGEKEEIPSE